MTFLPNDESIDYRSMIRSLLERLFDRSRYRMVSGYEYRLSGLACCSLGALTLYRYETLCDWLLAAGIVLYVLGFVKKRKGEGNGNMITIPDKSLFVLCWVSFFVSIIFVICNL